MSGPPLVNPEEARVRELVQRGATGQAAEAALRAFGPELLGYLTGMMRNDADADDVFAATAERIWRGLGAFEWRCSLRTWSYTIAHREMARHARRDGARKKQVPISEVASVLAEVKSTIGPAERFARDERLQALRAELPREEQALLVLRVDRGLAWDEIAAIVAEEDFVDDEDRTREAARLRKRFQLVKQRLAARAAEEGLAPARSGMR